MTKLESRLKENGYVFEKEQYMDIHLRRYLVKVYVKGFKKVYISREDILTSNGVTNKELKILNGYI